MNKSIKYILILGFGFLFLPQMFAQNKEGTVSIVIKAYCQIIVDHPERPIHFTYNKKLQHYTKHVRVISNCKWILSVRPQDRYLYCNNEKIDGNLISYCVANATGSGTIESPEPSYELYQIPYDPPFGIGSVEFDLIFSLDTSLLSKVRWGNYNTKVDITCTPDSR